MAYFIFFLLTAFLLGTRFYYFTDANEKNNINPNYGGNLGLGVTYSRLADDLPSPKDAIILCSNKEFSRIRIYKPHFDLLNSLKFSSMSVFIGVPNQDILNIAYNKNFSNYWINKYIYPYKSSISFNAIIVGHKINPEDSLASAILPAIRALKQALDNFNDPDLHRIHVTTVFSLDWLHVSFPPSAGEFDSRKLWLIRPIVETLQYEFLMLDLYPYFEFTKNGAYSNISLDYALLSSGDVIVQDGEIGYTNMLDGLIDAFYWAMEKINVHNVWIHVSETGWPISTGLNGADTDNAAIYVKNVMNRLNAGAISPKGKWAPRIFVYNLFLQSKAPNVMQNFGIFYPNMTPTLPIQF